MASSEPALCVFTICLSPGPRELSLALLALGASRIVPVGLEPSSLPNRLRRLVVSSRESLHSPLALGWLRVS
jgi:hypothetical protein